MKFTLIFLLTIMFGLTHTAQAATWGGGTGDWVSDNWGLDAPDGSPGDGTYTTETAFITTGGVVTINPGDSIAVGGTTFVSSGIINQSGGTASFNTVIRNRTQYNLTGGILTDDANATWYVGSGGEYNISGGSWSASTNGSAFRYENNGALNVSGGDIALYSILMDDGAHTGSTVLKLTGTDAGSLVTTIMRLLPNTGGSAESQFVFTDSGIDSWRALGGPNSLLLSNGVNSGDLNVNMATYTTTGTEGFKLFDYSSSAALGGTFGNVSVNSDSLGALTLGTSAGSLTPGQYFLEYADGTIGDGTDIVLYANTIPEPSTLVLVGLSLLALGAFRRFR